MIKKIGILLFIVLISIVLASIYGIIHNQISYSISNEYFTKFKFKQFGFVAYPDTVRMTIGVVGFLSTWWFGLLIGLINGIVGMFQIDAKIMWRSTIGAILRTILIAIIFSLLGILIGFFLQGLDLDWKFPDDISNKKSFLTAGTMHNFSYLGRMLGLIFGVIYQIKIKNKHSVKH